MRKIDELQLTNEQKTMFITLCGKALDYRSKNSILNDLTANDIVEKAGLDLKEYTDSKNRIIAVRARQFDEWTKDFIARNRNGVIVNLGCGLDSRVTRIQTSSQVTWFDIDFPEVIALRKEFYMDNDKYKMVSSSVTEKNWIEKIPDDKPTLIIAEGLMSYLSEQDVETLLNRLVDYFPLGEIAFNVISAIALQKGMKTTRAVQKWTVEDVKEVDKLNSKLKRIEVLSLFESKFIKKLPFLYRTLLGLAGRSSKYKNMMQLLRYEF